MKDNTCKKVFDRSRSYRATIEQKPTSMDRESVEDLSARQKVSRWIKKLSGRTPDISMDRKCVNFCWERRKIGSTNRNLSRIYWEAVKLDKSSFSKRGKTHKWMQSSKLLNQRSKQHVKLSKTSLNKINAKHSWSKTHTHIY